MYMPGLNSIEYSFIKSINMIKDKPSNFFCKINHKRLLLGCMIMTVCLLHGFSAEAQSNWLIGGNTGTSGSGVLGTTNNTSLPFITNSTQRMILDSVGNLLLGGTFTDDSMHRLQVAGGISVGSNISTKYWPNGLMIGSSVYKATDTTSTGTVTTNALNYFAPDTIASKNTVTYTNGVNVYIGAPVAGTHTTITNPYALYLAGAEAVTGAFKASGTIASSLSGSSSNFFTNVLDESPTSVSTWLFGGAASIYYRTSFYGSNSTVLAANSSATNAIIVSTPMHSSGTGTHAVLANMVIDSINVTQGGGGINTTADLYLNGASTAGTNNFALDVASGMSLFSGGLSTSMFANTGSLVAAAGTANMSTTVSSSNFAGGTSMDFRTLVGGYSTFTSGVGKNYASLIVGSGAITTAASGTHNFYATEAVKKLNITIGTAPVNNTAILYIDTASTAGTNNYALYAPSGQNYFGGHVLVGGGTVDTSALLQLNTTTKGLLIPRLTTSQISSIISPAKGLFAYDSTANLFKYYDGSAWDSLSTNTGSGNWSLTGNTGHNIFGTTSNTGFGTYTDGKLATYTDSLQNVTMYGAGLTLFNNIDPTVHPVGPTLSLISNGGAVYGSSTPQIEMISDYHDDGDYYAFDITKIPALDGGNIGGSNVPQGDVVTFENHYSNQQRDMYFIGRNIYLGNSGRGSAGNQVLISPTGLLMDDAGSIAQIQDSSSILQLNSTTQGVLLPRMLTSKVIAINNPANGLMVYDDSINTFKYYNGSTWNSLSSGSTGWSLSGNTPTSGSSFLGTTNNTSLLIKTNDTTRMIVDSIGNVQVNNKLLIGSVDPSKVNGYLLAVNGAAIFTRVRTKLYTAWPDYVFNDDYNLPALADVATYIKENKHLPGMPSADEMEKQGIDLGDNQTILVKKMEEFTLYIIDQNKKIEDQDQKIKELETQNQQLQDMQKEIDDLKKLIQKNN